MLNFGASEPEGMKNTWLKSVNIVTFIFTKTCETLYYSFGMKLYFEKSFWEHWYWICIINRVFIIPNYILLFYIYGAQRITYDVYDFIMCVMVKCSHEPKWTYTSDFSPVSLIDSIAIVVTFLLPSLIFLLLSFRTTVIILNKPLSPSIAAKSEN